MIVLIVCAAIATIAVLALVVAQVLHRVGRRYPMVAPTLHGLPVVVSDTVPPGQVYAIDPRGITPGGKPTLYVHPDDYRSFAELVDPEIARAADAFRATAGTVSEIDPDAPRFWQGVDPRKPPGGSP